MATNHTVTTRDDVPVELDTKKLMPYILITVLLAMAAISYMMYMCEKRTRKYHRIVRPVPRIRKIKLKGGQTTERCPRMNVMYKKASIDRVVRQIWRELLEEAKEKLLQEAARARQPDPWAMSDDQPRVFIQCDVRDEEVRAWFRRYRDRLADQPGAGQADEGGKLLAELRALGGPSVPLGGEVPGGSGTSASDGQAPSVSRMAVGGVAILVKPVYGALVPVMDITPAQRGAPVLTSQQGTGPTPPAELGGPGWPSRPTQEYSSSSDTTESSSSTPSSDTPEPASPRQVQATFIAYRPGPANNDSTTTETGTTS